MYACYRKSLFFLKAFTPTSSISLLPLFPKPSPSPLGHSYRTAESASEKLCFRTNYLINTCGFSPENASQLSRIVTFVKSDAPDAFLDLLKSLDLSDSVIRDTIKRAPRILSCDHARTITPKIEFFKSKGASSSQLARIVTFNPSFLLNSLENQIIPNYDLLRSLFHSDKKTVTSIQRCPRIVTDSYLAQKVKLLQDCGVSESHIARLIGHWPRVLCCGIDLLKRKADELLEMGFHPSKSTFIEALFAKVIISKSSWESKVELYRRWGWSEETLVEAFIRGPACIVSSCHKIDAVMDFLVTRMGWDSLYLAKNPALLYYSLEKRVVPRAFVLQFLQSRGAVHHLPPSYLSSDLRLLETMYDCYHKSLLYLKSFMRTSPIPRLCVLLNHGPSILALKYSTGTSTSTKQSFRVSYLINKCGFSAQAASELSSHTSFFNSEKADAVLKLLRKLNFSDSQLRDTIKRAPDILSRDPVNTLLPKLEFFKSKGASSSQLAMIITTNPWSLDKSLVNHIIPCYDLIKSFLHSDERTMKTLKTCPNLITDYRLAQKVKLLQDYGVPDSSVTRLFRFWPLMMNFKIEEFKSNLDELKELGLHPSKASFTDALRAKLVVRESSWKRKVELYRRWGWSDETFLKAFIKRPCCMLKSESKIEAIMEFFVNYMGWDSLVLSEYPLLFTLSLEKRIIPRASVLQFLQSRDLIEKQAYANSFFLTDELFYKKFVAPFKDEAVELLKLYEEKLNPSR
ncbi:transcription termination factor family protein [Senna tora]|uniref:Transcription termination factor family protein n=1 Tax=Senna tora TaxID=362788 RepID=A0A834T308_9FABA|nr:transcription termination factor family protein [Senna tora]